MVYWINEIFYNVQLLHSSNTLEFCKMEESVIPREAKESHNSINTKGLLRRKLLAVTR